MTERRHPRIHHERIDSTNTSARALATSGAEDGTVVTASFQMKGRGRLDRSWLAPPGVNLLASVILYPLRPLEEWGGIPLLAGLAVADAITSVGSIDTTLKWPNDVRVDQRKIAGVLVEAGQVAARAWCVIGVGINVNQREFEGSYRHEPTSMLLEAGRMHDVEAVLDALLSALDRWFGKWTELGTPVIVKAWKLRTDMIGSTRMLEDRAGTRNVTVLDICDDGALFVKHDDGSEARVYAGDLSTAQ
jgi:BirA family transcriptional regulator, biotin operon repressor / biotin---[acetyl-CoA-carboxylase] ligase